MIVFEAIVGDDCYEPFTLGMYSTKYKAYKAIQKYKCNQFLYELDWRRIYGKSIGETIIIDCDYTRIKTHELDKE